MFSRRPTQSLCRETRFGRRPFPGTSWNAFSFPVLLSKQRLYQLKSGGNFAINHAVRHLFMGVSSEIRRKYRQTLP